MHVDESRLPPAFPDREKREITGVSFSIPADRVRRDVAEASMGAPVTGLGHRGPAPPGGPGDCPACASAKRTTPDTAWWHHCGPCVNSPQIPYHDELVMADGTRHGPMPRVTVAADHRVEVCSICELPPGECVQHPGVMRRLTHNPITGRMLTKEIPIRQLKDANRERQRIVKSLGMGKR